MANLTRILYLFAMYTGLRAASNQARSLFLPRTRASIIHGSILRVGGSANIEIHVNTRVAPKGLRPGTKAGMISVSLVEPNIPKPLYWLLRLTSHFGTGHVEIAFYEEGETIVFFAIRNIIRSNINRLGMVRRFRSLQLGSNSDEINVAKQIATTFFSCGIPVVFAAPETCIELSVNRSLLNPKTHDKALEAMTRKYKYIASRIDTRHEVMRTTSGLNAGVQE